MASVARWLFPFKPRLLIMFELLLLLDVFCVLCPLLVFGYRIFSCPSTIWVFSFFNAYPYAGCVCRDSTICFYILVGVEFFRRSSLTVLDFLRILVRHNSASSTLIALNVVGFFHICSLAVLDFCRASLPACLSSVTSVLPLTARNGVVIHFLSRLLPVEHTTSICCVAFVLVLTFASDFSPPSSSAFPTCHLNTYVHSCLCLLSVMLLIIMCGWCAGVATTPRSPPPSPFPMHRCPLGSFLVSPSFLPLSKNKTALPSPTPTPDPSLSPPLSLSYPCSRPYPRLTCPVHLPSFPSPLPLSNA